MSSFFSYPRFTSPVSSPTTDLHNKPTSPALDERDHFAPTASPHNDLLFGGLDFEEPQFTEDRPFFNYDPASDSSAASSPHFIDSSAVSPFMFDDVSFDSGGYVSSGPSASASGDVNFMSQFIDDRLYSPTTTSPIPVPGASFGMQPYVAHSESIPFPIEPSSYHSQDFNQWHSPTANSLGLMLEDLEIKPTHNTQITLNDTVVEPAWVNELWDNSTLSSSPPTRPQLRHSPLSDRLQRRRVLSGPLSVPLAQPFLSSSAPSATITPALARAHSRRAESVSEHDDRDATIRGKKASSPNLDSRNSDNASDPILLKPVLKPPKLAPSAWQLFFTDWIQRHQATNRKKLNVAQAAKEAGQEYATLSAEEKEPYRRRSQAAKERRERDLDAYMRSLTPEEIKRENMFRAEQRKLGKSRRSNVKDPNAPKKPLSAYFMFLQRIRSDPALVKDIFGDETETTKQSVLAAAKWRSLTDEERKPFLAQAERDKIEYEAARRLYEEGTTGYTGSINFSISPPESFTPPVPRTIKVESESDGEGFVDERQRFY